MEGDASSDFSDWEVLSAASAAGGDDEDIVLVSGQGGDVLYDHFALDPSAPAAEGASWSEAASYHEEEVESGLGSVVRFDSISPEPHLDLIATAQLQLGGIDVTAAQGSLPGTSSAHDGATWTAHDEQIEEAPGAEIEAARTRGEPDSIPAHQALEGILDSDATALDALQLQAEDSIVQFEDSSAQLEDGGADPITQSSGLDAAATGDDEVSPAPPAPEEEPEQGKDASGCGESEGDDGKDCSSPLAAAAVAAPVSGEGAERQLIVWWRLPFKLIHYCAWKVRPVWSISIAAAFLGIVVLGRRMYRMRRKTPGLPQIKIAFDDKRASQFADRAARLNEAFLIAKRVPALRTSSGAALPWSMMQER